MKKKTVIIVAIVAIIIIGVTVIISIERWSFGKNTSSKLNFQWDTNDKEMSKVIEQILAHEDEFVSICSFFVDTEAIRDTDNIGYYVSETDSNLNFDISQIKIDMNSIIENSDFNEIYFSPEVISFDFDSAIPDVLVCIEYTYDDYYYESSYEYIRIAPHWYIMARRGD
jgi:hypothetical protein